jgi:cytoskeletal protein RodZ
MESPGKRLKAERESQNLSLKQVSESTKIRAHLLRAIEEDQYELISSPVYVKGFLEAYSRYLGLDPDDVVLQYQKYLEHKTRSERPESEQRMTRSTLKQWTAFLKKRVPLWLLVIFIPAVILLIAIMIYSDSLKPINQFLTTFEKKRSKPPSSIPSSPPTQNEGVKDE